MNFDELKEELKQDEGRVVRNGRHVVYADHLSYWTIGYGRLVDRRRGGGLREHEAEFLLENDIQEKYQQLRDNIEFFDRLPEGVQMSLMNMAFQLGVSGLLNFKRMIDALAIGHFERAFVEALDSKWARQTPERAMRVAQRIRKG